VVSAKKGGPPATLSSEVLESKKSRKTAQNRKKSQKVAKSAETGSNELFMPFLSVFLTHKSKMGSKTTLLHHFKQTFPSVWSKNRYPPTRSPRISQNSLPSPPKVADPPTPPFFELCRCPVRAFNRHFMNGVTIEETVVTQSVMSNHVFHLKSCPS
jgi:hypothetical protein